MYTFAKCACPLEQNVVGFGIFSLKWIFFSVQIEKEKKIFEDKDFID